MLMDYEGTLFVKFHFEKNGLEEILKEDHPIRLDLERGLTKMKLLLYNTRGESFNHLTRFTNATYKTEGFEWDTITWTLYRY